MSGFVTKLFLLCAGHALADYPLQGEFLAMAKNHIEPLAGVPWYQCLFAHAMIHGLMVYLVTHSVTLGATEVMCHGFIDYCKCDGELTFNQDQAAHYGCKLVWALVTLL